MNTATWAVLAKPLLASFAVVPARRDPASATLWMPAFAGMTNESETAWLADRLSRQEAGSLRAPQRAFAVELR